MRRSQLAINLVSTRHDSLEQAFGAYAAAGFRHVEMVIPQLRAYLDEGHTVGDLRCQLEDRGLDCIGGFETVLSGFGTAAARGKNHDQLVRNAELLAGLGATTMVVGTDGPARPMAAKAVIDELAEAASAVGKRIKGTGVTLCIEFNWSPVVKSLRTAAQIARRSRASNVGVLFDPAHYHCTPSTFDQLDAANVAMIKHVHVDDMADKPGELSDCNADRVLPGSGCLDLKAIFNRIEKLGYRGYYSIEMFSDRLWAMPPRRAAKLMYNALLPYCRGVKR